MGRALAAGRCAAVDLVGDGSGYRLPRDLDALAASVAVTPVGAEMVCVATVTVALPDTGPIAACTTPLPALAAVNVVDVPLVG